MFPPAIAAFVARPLVKWVGGAIVIALVLWFAVHKWNNFKEGLIEEGRVKGFAQAEEQFNERIAENDRVNRAVEQGIIEGLGEFAKAFGDQRNTRVERETRIETRIEGQIAENPEVFNNPECVVPADVIEGRNKIRALGPEVTQ